MGREKIRKEGNELEEDLVLLEKELKRGYKKSRGLVPQAGVALGTALVAKAEFPLVGGIILTTVVATTVLYEIIGPLCTKIALKKIGEIQ